MKKLAPIFTILLCFVLGSSVRGQVDPFFRPEVPDSMKLITEVRKLRPYLDSRFDIDRISACLRLGQIGGHDAVNLLTIAFEDEPYRGGIDNGLGVKYYALVSLGKIGDVTAEKFLKEIATTYALNLKRSPTPAFDRGDSLQIIYGAMDGLSNIKDKSIADFLYSIYLDEGNYWVARSRANYALLNLELKKLLIQSASDTAHFLIEKIKSTPWSPAMVDAKGNIDANYFVIDNIKIMLFKYRSFTAPYLEGFIESLNAEDPRKASLQQLKIDMERNPWRPKE